MATLVFGLDAADWDFIRPLIKEDRLPNLATLIDTGVSGTIQSTCPAMTPQAWTSMATGMNPGKHGVFDFRTQDRDSYRIKPVDSSNIDSDFVWEIFESYDYSVGIINFPLIYPPNEVCEFFISGIPTPPNANIAYPPELQDIIDASSYRVHPQVDPEDGLKPYYEDLLDLTISQGSLMSTLFEKYDLDLAIVVFMGVDWIQHYFWDKKIDGKSVVKEFYEEIDRILGDLMTALGPEVEVIVMSDHGATDLDGELHLNSLLAQRGYLTQTDDSRSVLEHAVDRVFAKLWQIGGSLPAEIKGYALEYAPERLLTNLQTAADFGQSNLHNKIDWSRTVAFSYGSMGRVFIHTEDDYSDGVVAESEYESVREELLSMLTDLCDPKTGQKIVANAYRGENVYHGPEIDNAPDIVFNTKDSRYMCYGDFGEEWIHEPRHRVADHASEGVLVFSGEPYVNGSIKVDICDVTPTLLYRHNIPILESMDGNILTQVFTEDFRQSTELETTNKYNISDGQSDMIADSKKEVESRLEDLGYL